MKIQCIYKIINTKTNQIYIGSTLDFEWRKKKHIYQLKKNIHHSRYLQNAWNFYGIDCFEFSIIERIEDKNQLVIREDFYIRSLNPDYNTMREVKSHIGLKRSEETKRKMSLAQVGKNHTEETKEKIRKITTGVKQSKETIEKRILSLQSSNAWRTGVKSVERSEKIKLSRLKNGGYIVSDEQKKKISDTLKSKQLQSAISKKIEKYDLNGNFICEYPSLQKAEKDNMLYRGSLHQNIQSLKKQEYKNYIWKIIE
jgi:group I intron endonuclease